MRIAYANAYYRADATSGGNAHVYQFAANAKALGHEVWTWPGDEHPDAQRLPPGRLARLARIRQMDVVYVRLEWHPPGPCRWAIPPCRRLTGSPAMVWEFNTVPEFGRVVGQPQDAVDSAIAAFRRYGQGCDLAVCVSESLSNYVRDSLGIQPVVTVPNGSDPALFRPDAPVVRRMRNSGGQLNVVWMGSAGLAWHNLELLRRTAEVLWSESGQTKVAFHVLGAGLRNMADMPPNVHYHGAANYHQLPGWLAAMDVGLVTYRAGPGDFSSPLKLFDYMASALALVGTPQPQFARLLEELGQQDQLVPREDAEMLASKLQQMAGERERVAALGQAGRQLLVRRYSWRRAVEDTLDAMRDALNARTR